MAKIMIIDDDLQTSALMANLVELTGNESVIVNASGNAMKTAKSSLPDLILLDIMMPEVSGIDLCRLFKAEPALASIPVIMVSALHDIKSKRDAAEAGAMDYLTKPLTADEFTNKILSALKKIQNH